jgi:GntR family transcriptional regulator, vanillate catabolism transcriptional regulator
MSRRVTSVVDEDPDPGDAPALAPVRIQSRTRLVDELVERLQSAILSGALAPGTPLRQVDLSTQLGVSRTPLREAFRVLESLGLVEVSDHNRTIKVVQLAPEELAQLYELREVVDPLAARLTARRHLSEAALGSLTTAVEEMDRAVEPFDWEHFNHWHQTFHVEIARLSGNSYVASVVPIIQVGTMAFAQILAAESEGVSGEGPSIRTVKRGQRQHRELCAAISAGDEERAAAAAFTHMRETLELVRSPEWAIRHRALG